MYNQNDLKSEKEREIMQKATDIFSKLLDDLHKKDLLRDPPPGEKKRFMSLLKNAVKFQDAFNETTKRFSSTNFEDLATKTSLTEPTLMYWFFSLFITNLLICYETLVKLCLSFFLDEKSGIRRKAPLGEILGKIEKTYPEFVDELGKMINRDVRNALAHGTFWLESDGLHYAKDSYLDKENIIKLAELQTESRNVSIVGRAFVHTVRKKAGNGYF